MKLESECWKDCLKVAPLSKNLGAKEARPEFSVLEGRLGYRLSNC